MDPRLPKLPGLTTGLLSPAESNASTPAITPLASPTLEARELIGDHAHKLSANKLPPLSRDFPKPQGEINVEEALERQPGKWTIQGQIKENQQRERNFMAKVDNMEQRKKDFEAAKRDLLAYHTNFHPDMLKK